MNTEEDDIINEILKRNAEKDDPHFDYLFTAFAYEPYKVEHKFSQAFWDFGYRINSLYRYYSYSELYLKHLILKHQEHLKYNQDDDAFYEIVSTDSEYFFEHHYSSLISRIVSILENLLFVLVEELNKASVSPPVKLSKIEKKLYILNICFSNRLVFGQALLDNIKNIVDVRNDCIHSFSNIDKKFVRNQKNDFLKVTVENCFFYVPEMVNIIEEQYWALSE